LIPPKSGKDYTEFVVSSFSHITSIVIPFFEKHPLHGNKLIDFNSFKCVAGMVERKQHLTTEGLDGIVKIKGAMNLARYKSKD
jgi:hypothetical protein